MLVHASAASKERPEGTVIASAKGWYDAGDYNKYIVDSGISTYTLLAAFEHYRDYFARKRTGIPESGNRLPDILDEALWNPEWMLTMQDPHDGGVYNKLTRRSGHSSLHAHTQVLMKGGAFPLTIRGSGVAGTITVAGLPGAEQHALVVRVLRDSLKVNESL